jgi:Family of unknown function (DUF5670)
MYPADRSKLRTMQGSFSMLFIGVFFLALWITGLATANTLGGFIHVLLVLAIIVLLSRMIRGNGSSKVAELRASATRPGTSGSER